MASVYGTRIDIQGIDVSKWQGDIDWQAVRGAGYEFAVIKLTEGVGYVDPRAAENIAGARDAGLRVMVYAFSTTYNADPREPELDAMAEARHFVNTYRELGCTGSPWVDIEWTTRAPDKNMKAQHRIRWLQTWLRFVDDELGVRSGIYSGPSYWRYKMGNTMQFADRKLWNASYRRKQKLIGNWRSLIWQKSGKGKVPGIKGNCDLNVFTGTRAEFEAMF